MTKDLFELHIPFKLSPSKDISNIDEYSSFKLGGYGFELKKVGSNFVLSVSTFETKEEARMFFSTLKLLMYWLLIKRKMGIKFSKIVSDVNYYEEPIKPDVSPFKELLESSGCESIFGFYDSNQTVVRPKDKCFLGLGAGELNVSAGIGGNIFLNDLREPLEFSSLQNILDESKLILAIELYSLSHFEISRNARFITLVSVLEALTPDTMISEISMEVLELTKSFVKDQRNKFGDDTSDWDNINRLLNRIRLLENEAIGTSMRNYVDDIIEDDFGDRKEISKKLSEIYGIRSDLLHEGYADEKKIQEGLDFLNEFIPMLLEKIYIEITNE